MEMRTGMGTVRNKVRNCDFKKDYVNGNAHVRTEELQR
jgi:N-acetylglutamate synthase/N-acetylornithine aminotransferase